MTNETRSDKILITSTGELKTANGCFLFSVPSIAYEILLDIGGECEVSGVLCGEASRFFLRAGPPHGILHLCECHGPREQKTTTSPMLYSPGSLNRWM